MYYKLFGDDERKEQFRLEGLFPDDIETENSCEAHVLISVGGDGTFLRMAHECIEFLSTTKWFLGVNFGTVGFLANDAEDLKEYRTLYDIITYGLFSRVSLLEGLGRLAFNEFAFLSRDRGRLFDVEVEFDDEKVVYRGDGLIVCTALGSTAYNLSANGPILHPRIEGFVLTPICPFTLADRSVVLPHTEEITVSCKDAEVYIDGRLFGTGDVCSEIKLSEHKMQLIRISKFPTAIQGKLGWNNNIK